MTTYTFTVPFENLDIVDVTQVCNTQLYVFTHAEISGIECEGDCSSCDRTEHETGWGGSTCVNIETPGRWYCYGQYTICCDFGEPDVPACQTAFAKGSHIWTTDRKSNPENLPSLRLTRNRWGWAIKLCATGESTYDIWAGAGLNDTAKGVKVGTLTVNWNGSTAAVTYAMNNGCQLEEVHLYAQDGAPTTIAPGQYGYLDSFDPNRTTYTFNVSLADTNGDGCVWLIAHAVVCCG
jgi:hypothetical protein